MFKTFNLKDSSSRTSCLFCYDDLQRTQILPHSSRLHLKSVPNYCFRHFSRFLMKIHIPVKEVHLKTIKGMNSKISSLTTKSIFTQRNSCERKNKSPYGIYNSPRQMSFRNHSEHLLQFFLTFFMSLAMQNPKRLFIFSCVLKSDTVTL